MGIEDERLRLEWISASEADKLKKVVDGMVNDLRRLGPFKPAVEEPRRKAAVVG
jgi:F420-non-reducing hydrogenase iron-sulfur subunit